MAQHQSRDVPAIVGKT